MTTDYCDPYKKLGIKCILPEINAVRIDLMIIGQLVENAITAPYHESITSMYSPTHIKEMMVSDLNEAKRWFDDIIMYLGIYKTNLLGSSNKSPRDLYKSGGFPKITESVEKLKNYIEKTLITKVKQTNGDIVKLKNVAIQDIYGFQGPLGSLGEDIEALFKKSWY